MICRAYAAQAVLFAAFLSAQATPPPAEAEGSDPTGTFVASVDVEVVNIDVYVSDKSGQPVTGLTLDDFQLTVDGRPATATNFLVYDGAPRRSRENLLPPPPAADGAPPGIAESQPLPAPDQVDPPPAPRQPLYLVIYIDNTNIRPENRRWVTGQLRRVVPLLVREGDAVMLVSYDRRVIVRQPLSTSSDDILAGIDEIDMLTGGGAAADIDRRRVLSEVDQASSYPQAMSAVRSYADSWSSEVRFAMAALSDFVNSLSGIQGRKALLYVSDGLPLVVGDDLFTAIDERFGINTGRNQAFNYDFSRQFDRLTTLANSSGVTFYTLDAKGLQGDESVDAGSAALVNIRNRTSIEAARKINLATPLRLMAEETGGQSIVGTNAVVPALERVVEDFRTYYSLGYTPLSADGRYHEISVTVQGRKDLLIRHRDGYRLRDPQARLLDTTTAALQHGVERGDLGVWVEFEPPTVRDGGTYTLPALIRIPLGTLTLVPRGESGTWGGRVVVTVGTLSTEGDVAPVQAQPPHDIVIPAADLERARASFYTYTLPLIVRGGTQRVAIGVRDELGGQVDTLTELVRIAE